MAVSLQIKIIILSILLSDTAWLCFAESEPKKEKDELTAEETKKLEIIKRIKKINEDGSYTIGYEADDGSFKIESRDVLGHIKGTYGFVDQDGQLKRVSYSTTNATEILTKPPEDAAPSVVQRIPSKKPVPTTFVFTSTQSTPTTSSIAATKRKLLPSSTEKPNYHNVINVSKATALPKFVTYTSAAPKVLVQSKSSATGGQISRPELVTIKPTESSNYNRFNPVDEKPVTEEAEPEIRGNILRRELPQRQEAPYDVREHIFTLQQSMGSDAVDVYSSSMTTGTPRPLFTTTPRSIRPVLFSTVPTSTTSRSTPPYPLNYLKNSLQDIENSSPDYQHQETTTDSPEPTPMSAAQIPANRPDAPEPLVAIRQPNQKNVILVPLSQFQGRVVPVEHLRPVQEDPRQYYVQQANKRPSTVDIDQQQALVRRLPPYPLRPMPVQVDENGYIRELPRQVPTPYPVPVPATPVTRYVDSEQDIDNIQPPVSTKDFQRLLQQLILRQSRLEKISALTRQPPEMLIQSEQPRFRQVYQQVPYYVHRQPPRSVQYVPQGSEQRQNYVEVEQQQLVSLNNQQRPNIYEDYDSQSYRPNRRVARLLPTGPAHQESDEYLPSDVREMLLLRMLQLAINPALPLDEEDVEVTKSMPVKRTPVRNVEILGEEESSEKGSKGRSKRFIGFKSKYYF